MVAAANDTPAATPPVGDNPAQGGVNGGGYSGTRGGQKTSVTWQRREMHGRSLPATQRK